MPRNLTLAALAAGTALGLVASLQGLIHARLAGRPASVDPLLANLPYWLLWATLAPVIWRLRHVVPGGFAGRARITWHVTVALVMMVCQSAALYGWQRLTGLTDVAVPIWQGALGISYLRLVPNALIYGFLLVLVWAAPGSAAATRSGSEPRSDEPDAQAATPGPVGHLVIKNYGRVTLLKLEEIDWIEAADYCARVYAGGRAILLRETMASLEARLDPAQFCRVHRSAIVNLDRVREIRTAARGEHSVVLADGRKVPVNRSRKNRLEAVIALR
jgi:LytTr DNA-binding domain-containing protein